MNPIPLNHNIFKNEFVETFPGDESGNKRPRQTPRVLYSKVNPTPVKKPELIAWSDELAEELNLEKPNEEDVKILGGNLVTPTMQPYAACYAGHQFGNWAGQLGDGRAITLGELQLADGSTRELQLKGPGQTPYSRSADGRAVLRSSVREYLMSEFMYHLGVPTTRALSLVSTGDQVMRDMFYNGNAAYEPGAIVARVAPSFLRFGNFEMLAARQETENLRKLADWTIDKFYPHLSSSENRVLEWFSEVVERTATMVVEWMRVGFVHGVMNTDNMSILGLTIDYGPYSFLDDYDRNFTPNTTDLPGKRYAFGKQSSIAYWNLGCLAGAISLLLKDSKELEERLERFEHIFWEKYFAMMGNKLGLDRVGAEDREFINRFEEMLAKVKPDMTIFYQLLADIPLDLQEETDIQEYFKESFYKILSNDNRKLLADTIKGYSARISQNSVGREESLKTMRAANPRFILRNYLLHNAIEELTRGEDTLFVKLHEAMKEPYSNKHDEFFAKRPTWATQKAGCSMLSCSS
ncbi:MAG TPA: YdiU family protein [Cytophagaceae bacterium]|jgi:uncharacterized protein YdiU (UPF0061 family)